MLFKDKKVLVTGGAGFIGSNLVDRLLAEGARITVLDNLDSGSKENLAHIKDDVDLIVADIRDAASVFSAVMGKDIVFHLAANASVPRSATDRYYDYTSNSLGSFNVADASTRMGIERLVYASTAAVYGNPEYTPMDENHPLNPLSIYGASKLSGERVGTAFHSTYGFPFTAIRVFNTYGPRMRKYVMYDLIAKLLANPRKLEVLGTGEQIRDYSYVSDTVEAFITGALNPMALGQIYNVAGGRPTSIKELVGFIITAMNLSDVEVTYTGKSWKGDVHSMTASIDKLTSLGFMPKTDILTGIGLLVEWIKGQHDVIPNKINL